jgi:hypothetical protein
VGWPRVLLDPGQGRGLLVCDAQGPERTDRLSYCVLKCRGRLSHFRTARFASRRHCAKPARPAI